MNTPRKYAVGEVIRRNRTMYEILDRDGQTILAEEIEHGVPTGSFEVWRVKTLAKDKKMPNGTTLLANTEVLPTSEQWGIYGWTYSGYFNRDAALAAARKRFNSM